MFMLSSFAVLPMILVFSGNFSAIIMINRFISFKLVNGADEFVQCCKGKEMLKSLPSTTIHSMCNHTSLIEGMGKLAMQVPIWRMNPVSLRALGSLTSSSLPVANRDKMTVEMFECMTRGKDVSKCCKSKGIDP
jgi:hypothetical protein